MFENELLVDLYNKLHSSISEKYSKKKTFTSLIYPLVNVKSNNRLEIFDHAKFEIDETNSHSAKVLVDDGLARWMDDNQNLILTLKGIWEYESSNNLVDFKTVMSILDEKYLDFIQIKDNHLKDRDKVVLFSMIATRAFSHNCPVDLMMDDAKDVWKDVLDSSRRLLAEVGVIENSEDDKFYGKKGNEHLVSNIFRHTDELPKLTQRIFNALGNQRYYLHIYEADVGKPVLKLGYLFKKIKDVNSAKGKKIGKESIWDSSHDKIADHLYRIAIEKNIYLFDPQKYEFLNTRFQQDIVEALIRCI